jgi:hypothetical protein
VTRTFVTLLIVALMSACKNKAAPAAPPTPAALREQADAGPWVLTLKMLDGFLGYQRTLLLQAGKMREAVWDGGSPSIEQKANLDEEARLAAGLTPDDVLKIEAMLSRVAAKRITFRLMRLDEALPGLPADPDAKAAEAQEALKKSIADLAAEREAFGSGNIDALLAREEELLKNWGLLMDVSELAPRKR